MHKEKERNPRNLEWINIKYSTIYLYILNSTYIIHLPLMNTSNPNCLNKPTISSYSIFNSKFAKLHTHFQIQIN